MKTILQVIEIVLSVFLIILVLLQQREGGLGSAFGGDSSGAYRTRRGAEKIIFQATVVVGVAFVGLALVSIFI
ncbi:MAG: preprotein translocase subunit SecG [Patescibacteria group bacterium]